MLTISVRVNRCYQTKRKGPKPLPSNLGLAGKHPDHVNPCAALGLGPLYRLPVGYRRHVERVDIVDVASESSDGLHGASPFLMIRFRTNNRFGQALFPRIREKVWLSESHPYNLNFGSIAGLPAKASSRRFKNARSSSVPDVSESSARPSTAKISLCRVPCTAFIALASSLISNVQRTCESGRRTIANGPSLMTVQ